jgi:hypothetical protein
MPKKTLNLTGTTGTTYDLDKIEAENRMDSASKLVVHVHQYDPELGQSPNPSNLKLGQIWLSKKVSGNGTGG